jgi:hypothetical protein
MQKLEFPQTDPYAKRPGDVPYKLEILWDVVIGMTILHIGALYFLIQLYFGQKPSVAAFIFSEFN